MDLATQRLMSGAAGASGDKVYVDDVFSTYLYEGNATARSINNGIDLAGEGGMVWTKSRSHARNYALHDSERGVTCLIQTNTTGSQYCDATQISSFNSNGFSLGTDGSSNTNGDEYTSWTFRKAPGFFDIVTYTGSGSTQTISHSLESVPGMIIVKRLDTSTNWGVYHRGQVGYDGGTKAEDYRLLLDETTYSNNDTYWGDTAPTTTQFTVGDAHTEVNASGGNYVAYIFAHDEQSFGKSADSSVIKCGNYTGNGSTNGPEVNVGWEPQWIMVKRTDGGTGLWLIADNMRGVVNDGNDPYLQANGNNAEYTSYDWIEFTPTGFKLTNTGVSLNSNGHNYVYTAIRRSDGYVGKPADAGTDVFAMDTGSSSSGIPTYDSGFPVDFAFTRRPAATDPWYTSARLIDGKYLLLHNSDGIGISDNFIFDSNTGWAKDHSSDYQSWMWKRHAGFDVVTYSGLGGNRTHNHSLGIIPEMIWVKCKAATGKDWWVYHKGLNGGTNPEDYYIKLNSNDGEADQVEAWNDTAPTATSFTVGSNGAVNSYGDDYLALLFSSVSGISKVGSYTGNGSTGSSGPFITTGFSPRFIIVKRVDSNAGYAWNLHDTNRGIDNRLRIQTTAAQATLAAFDLSSTGFRVKTDNASYNTSSGKYVYYAHA
jgi:hypothetical protein